MVGPQRRSTRLPRAVLLAHYDAVSNSPGANDNGAAVFQLMDAALILREECPEGWLVVFTDKEELTPQDGAKDQGSYGLAEGFKSIGIADAGIFNFDVCGRGDRVIISTTLGEILPKQTQTRGLAMDRLGQSSRRLRIRALEIGRILRQETMLGPVPFSDDAGFLAAGLAAQTITTLPDKEAEPYYRNIRSGRMRTDRAWMDLRNSDGLPETWALINGADDRPETLHYRRFGAMTRLAVALAQAEIQAPSMEPMKRRW